MSKYFTVKEELENQYYAMPKALVLESKYEKMSRDAKFLYAILKDRYSISNKNTVEGSTDWIDDKGRIYFVYEQKELSELFGASEKTLRKYINELIKFDLLEVKRLGLGSANRYYLMKPVVDDMLKNKEKKKASAPTEAKKSIQSNNSICNNNNNNTCNAKNKEENIPKKLTEVEKAINESNVNIKKTDIEECISKFTDIDKLKKALKEMESRKSHGIKALRQCYESIGSERMTNNCVPSKTQHDDFTTKTSAKKNKFENFEQTFTNYTKDEFNEIVDKSQEAKFGNSDDENCNFGKEEALNELIKKHGKETVESWSETNKEMRIMALIKAMK